MLEEVKLLVAGGGPEVGTLHDQALPFRFALSGDEGEAGLPSEGRIGQHHVEVDARWVRRLSTTTMFVSSPPMPWRYRFMTPSGPRCRRSPSREGAVSQVGKLALIHARMAVDDVVVAASRNPPRRRRGRR